MTLTTWMAPKFQNASPFSPISTRPRLRHLPVPSAQALLGASSGCVMSLGGNPLYEQYWKTTTPSGAFPESLSTCAQRTSSGDDQRKVSSYVPASFSGGAASSSLEQGTMTAAASAIIEFLRISDDMATSLFGTL